MLVGGVFPSFFRELSFLTPYLISCMLLLTYCRLAFREMRFSRMHAWMLGVQLAGSVVVYGTCVWFDSLLAEGVMICVLAPTAVAAAVITGMLGGNVACLAAYTLLSNVCVAVVAPLFFSCIGTGEEVSFWHSFALVGRQVGPLLLLPLAGAWMLERFVPVVHRRLKAWRGLSFYLWSFSLTIVTGNTVYFIAQQDRAHYGEEVLLAGMALGLCVVQYFVGHCLGRCYGEVVAGSQGLGQKNTILAIWMAQTYLAPLSSIAPAAYVLWQNLINSWQLWRAKNKEGAGKHPL